MTGVWLRVVARVGEALAAAAREELARVEGRAACRVGVCDRQEWVAGTCDAHWRDGLDRLTSELADRDGRPGR